MRRLLTILLLALATTAAARQRAIRPAIPPLPQATVDIIGFISSESRSGMNPGDSQQLYLGYWQCCVVPVVVRNVQVFWSVAPANSGLTVDGAGVLRAAPDVEAGRVFLVMANIENGRKVLTETVPIWTPESNPFVGYWREKAETSCLGGGDQKPVVPIAEMFFGANGRFSVTWRPFEVYVDYWGTYTFDLDTHRIRFVVDRGNYVPKDIRGEGTFELEKIGLWSDGSPRYRLRLRNIWLGRTQDDVQPAGCGLVFE